MSPVFPLKQRQQIQQIHTELLKAGIELICEKGVRKWTIDEVIQRVQIGKGIFSHFSLLGQNNILSSLSMEDEIWLSKNFHQSTF